MVKKIRMPGNIAKRKRDEEEHSEEDREFEAFSNDIQLVEFNKSGSL